MDNFDQTRSGTGTLEWAEKNENIALGCPNRCLYCFASHTANRFKRRARKDWQIEELTKRAFVTSYPKRSGVIMYPSAHDITPFNVLAYLRVAKLMLAAGNKLLIVSKPNLECIRQLITELAPFKNQILLRFTIGTTSEEVAAFWEPGAPSPAKRISALEMAFDADFRTSVSAEPLLGGLETAQSLLAAVTPYLTDTIWIGKMNKIQQRVEQNSPLLVAAVEAIERQQTDERILCLYEKLKDNPIIRWKDSVKEVLARHPSSVV